MKSFLNVFIVIIFIYECPGFIAGLNAAGAQSGINAVGSGSLSLQLALSKVFERNPQFMVSELEVEAAAAGIIQAGLKPNPEINLEAENFPAMSGAGLSRYLESTIKVSQRLETGGKRIRRIRAAESYRSMAEQSMEVKRAELAADTARAFFDVLAAQERLRNQEELTELSRQSRSVVLERIAAGKASPVEQTLAEMELTSTLLEEDKQRKNLLAAKNRLAGLWGGNSQDFAQANGPFEIPPEPVGRGQGCPDLALAEASIDFRKKSLLSEQAARNPDITFSGGYRHMNDENIHALVFGVSLPLPIFDKRQGAVSEAKIRLDKANSEKNAVERRLRAALTQARHEREIALIEADMLSQKALPTAMNAVSAVEEGYRLGKFAYMNVLDAQRTHAQLLRRYIEAVASGLQATVDINRLVHCDSEINAPTHSPDMEGDSDER